ncbi:hypothetical protein FNF29_03505 [Cafeteria roenbergensis]|uniref:Beta-hexosaminidase n=1 Tax=Cafeteria roenbergensis TaxID=33653 RepID=A0A5A8CIU2_CAFRO|nr:hypothetical protein FNF29_03505 [Cafeteria roenbergensis]|eukprot:KAA0152983.1 hypothetical protein FNF29_03505 [Cafeteria roenbergensis]
MRCATAILLAAAASAAAADTSYFWYEPNMDAPKQDLRWEGGDLASLRRACAADSACLGFNTDGWLKTCVTGDCLKPSSETSLYVKKTAPMPAGLWPKPTSVSELSGVALSADPSTFQFSASSGSSSPVLETAFKRYQGIIFNPRLPTPPLPPAETFEATMGGARRRQPFVHPTATGSLSGVVVSVKEVEPPLQMGVDESYELTVPSSSGTVQISAQTTWGALRALERLSQLTWWTGKGTAFTVFSCVITDSPRFSHRGVLVDTARHFMPLPSIKMAIDSLVYSFYSVFHWHIVDDQSFPYVSTTFPELSAEGAFDENHIYSQKDVADVLQYAHERGIRVLIEFDTPGHTASWGVSHPELLVPCYTNGKPNGARYGANPLLNSTFEFMGKFFAEVASVFPDNYVHVGGDELSLGQGSCWTTNPDMQAWMKAHGETDYAALENVYEQRFVNVVSATNKSLIGWQELFDNGINLPSDFVVNVWKGGWQEEMSKVTAKFRTVLSSPYYENYIENPYSNSGDWMGYYTTEPLNFTGTAEQKARVMGCETSFWAEYIDSTNFFSRAWPRAAASGERFWSDASVNDPVEASGRLHAHRCRLVARGIPAEPVEGPSFCRDEYDVQYNPPF